MTLSTRSPRQHSTDTTRSRSTCKAVAARRRLGTADALTSWSSNNLVPVLLWDYYYGLYSRYLTSYSDQQFFAIIDSLSSYLNPWMVPRSTRVGSL